MRSSPGDLGQQAIHPPLVFAVPLAVDEAGIPSEAELGELPQAIQQQSAMMREIWEGARVVFIVKVDGEITETNAKYVSRNRDAIGLLRLNLGEAFRAPEGVKKMKAPRSLEAVEQQLQGPLVGKHIKMETQEQVEIEFE